MKHRPARWGVPSDSNEAEEYHVLSMQLIQQKSAIAAWVALHPQSKYTYIYLQVQEKYMAENESFILS
jgi:hypothetical protein